MKKIVVIGTFGFGISGLDGQTIKTINVYSLIKSRTENASVDKVDTLKVRRKIGYALSAVRRIITCDELIILPADNSLALFFPFCFILSLLFRFKIILICIGGWQYEFFVGNERWKPHRLSMSLSKRIHCFMPEMEMVNELLVNRLSFRNTRVLPNFRFIDDVYRSKYNFTSHLSCAFIARINKKKGYLDVIRAASICESSNIPVLFSFYGSIEEGDKSDFFSAIEGRSNIFYGGEIPQEDVNQTLSNHDIVLLPTHYFTEGFPGTILDAYIAGVPVIATEWKYAHEFIEHEQTGLIIPFGDDGTLLAKAIFRIDADRKLLARMKDRAYQESKKYSANVAWGILKDVL